MLQEMYFPHAVRASPGRPLPSYPFCTSPKKKKPPKYYSFSSAIKFYSTRTTEPAAANISTHTISHRAECEECATVHPVHCPLSWRKQMELNCRIVAGSFPAIAVGEGQWWEREREREQIWDVLFFWLEVTSCQLPLHGSARERERDRRRVKQLLVHHRLFI